MFVKLVLIAHWQCQQKLFYEGWPEAGHRMACSRVLSVVSDPEGYPGTDLKLKNVFHMHSQGGSNGNLDTHHGCFPWLLLRSDCLKITTTWGAFIILIVMRAQTAAQDWLGVNGTLHYSGDRFISSGRRIAWVDAGTNEIVIDDRIQNTFCWHGMSWGGYIHEAIQTWTHLKTRADGIWLKVGTGQK